MVCTVPVIYKEENLLKQIWVQSDSKLRRYLNLKNIDDVIPLLPEVPLPTATLENFEWFGQELTELWIDKSNNKDRVCIFIDIDS